MKTGIINGQFFSFLDGEDLSPLPEVKIESLAELPPEPEQEKQPWHCKNCRDTGVKSIGTTDWEACENCDLGEQVGTMSSDLQEKAKEMYIDRYSH